MGLVATCQTVLDDYSRYILAWTLRTSMQASDVTETLDLARAQAGVDRVRVVHRPRRLSDMAHADISQELADYLDTHGLAHTRGAPYQGPMTQGKIERYHRPDEERRQASRSTLARGNSNAPWRASWKTTITGAIMSHSRT